MAPKSDALNSWRGYFGGADSDIFGVIEYAILVAASDWPKEFRLRRARIAEMLFSCRFTRCLSCDNVQLAVPGEEDDEDNEELNGLKESLGCNEGFVNKDEFKENSSKNGGREIDGALSNQSFNEVEALTFEIEEENQTVGEVLRIKEILENYKEESDGLLFESLRRLQLMGLTVENLKATEIGRAVNGVRKHRSKKIQHLARVLIEGWKQMVDEWCNTGSAIAEGSPESVDPSDPNEGLPSPPLDEGALLATQTTSIELSQFFDGMDDDGNPRNGGGFNKRHEIERKPMSIDHVSARKEHLHNKHEISPPAKGKVSKHDELDRQNKPRSAKANFEHKPNDATKLQQPKDLFQASKKSPTTAITDKSKSSNDMSSMKLEAAKRKLHERYQQVENAKKQRTVQVMELHDLPKQGLGGRNIHPKSGFKNRNRSNMRH